MPLPASLPYLACLCVCLCLFSHAQACPDFACPCRSVQALKEQLLEKERLLARQRVRAGSFLQSRCPFTLYAHNNCFHTLLDAHAFIMALDMITLRCMLVSTIVGSHPGRTLTAAGAYRGAAGTAGTAAAPPGAQGMRDAFGPQKHTAKSQS